MLLIVFKDCWPQWLIKLTLYDINSAFCIPHDNSPCIKYKHGMHGLQKEKWEICLALS